MALPDGLYDQLLTDALRNAVAGTTGEHGHSLKPLAAEDARQQPPQGHVRPQDAKPARKAMKTDEAALLPGLQGLGIVGVQRREVDEHNQRQQHQHFTATTTMKFTPKSENELAGLTCYQSERFNYVFGITKKDKDFYILLEKTEKGQSKIIASEKIDVKMPVQLQVVARGDEYKFNYSVDGVNFTNLGGTVSGDILSTNVAGGFTGSLIGLYATSANDAKP